MLQAGFAVAGLAAVVIADRVGVAVLAGDPTARQLHAFVVVGGRVLAGLAFGLLFRLQLVSVSATVEPDQQLRWLIGLPAALIAAWPVLLPALPPWTQRLLPGALSAAGSDMAPVAAVLLGLVMALGLARPPR
jgi:hypothetical protein